MPRLVLLPLIALRRRAVAMILRQHRGGEQREQFAVRQPEIRVGTIPGSGGTQRLVRAIGKAKAMDLVLTGRAMDAVEAERCGLVARVVPAAALLDEALKAAATIARHSAPVLQLARAAVLAAHETTLAEGLRIEAGLFEASFDTEDRREGMSAFLDKRRPDFKHR